jgi:RecB family exonuclease
MFRLPAQPEVSFYNEGVVLGEAILSGKIDRLEVDAKSKTVSVVDYKTGKPYTRWEKELKLLKYKQQLYFYKILLEGSHTWQGYKVVGARLEFVEPDENGKIVPGLEINFTEPEEKEMKVLIESMWIHVMNLNLPDISKYSEDHKGSIELIDDILKNTLH